MREAGLGVEVDRAGNLFGRLRGLRPELPEVWTGSHLDSVPNGGRFDGALGVVGGLEAVERLAQLEEAGAPLGVVTGIAAAARGEVVFQGREGHAGTTPMPSRNDALVAAAEFVLRLREAAASVDGTVATVGRLAVEPGASNVIPSRVVM